MTSPPRPVITLTTDFGRRDPYVAAMKGVLYSIARDAIVVDLSHEITPHDILAGALFLAGALPYFPPDTIHVVVVDPGVGTERNPVALCAGGQVIVCPDNGLPSLFLREHPIQQARLLTNPTFMREPVSTTFHGRDIFAPAAAWLARGEPFEALGEELDTVVMLDIPQPRHEPESHIHGEIIHVDRFGNLVTNIHRSLVRSVFSGPVSALEVAAGSWRIGGIHKTYGEVPLGAPLALFGSARYLEIALNRAHAHKELGLGKGDSVNVEG